MPVASFDDRALEHMIGAVASSCAVARRLQRDAGRPAAPAKADESPVTVADFAVQALLTLALEEIDAAGAGPSIIGEESAAMLRQQGQRSIQEAVIDAVRSCRDDVSPERILDAIDLGARPHSGERWWTIDPIDGTRGFVKNRQYAICLALVERGVVTFGALGCPNLPLEGTAPLEPHPDHGVVVVAVRGAGAWQRDERLPHDAGHRLERHPTGNRLPVLAASYHSSDVGAAFLDEVLEALGPGAWRLRVDSQCKYAMVARGQVDAYVRVPRRDRGLECTWDHAPGSLIAAEAGAVVTDLDGRPLEFGHGRHLSANRGVICAAPALHGRLLARLADEHGGH